MPRPRHLLAQRVLYIDTDAAQVVHHATYLRYFEAARIEFLRHVGWDYSGWVAREQLGLPVAENFVKYRAPARFDELLELETWVSEGKRSALRFSYLVRRDGRVITEGTTLCPCTTMAGQLRRVPVELVRLCLGDEFDEAKV